MSWCKVVFIEGVNCIHLRTDSMDTAYVAIQEALQKIYVELPEGVLPVTRGEMHAGLSCILVRNGCAHRCEIIYADDDGYCEVLLVDLGETVFVEGNMLYYPDAISGIIPALRLECSLYGIGELNLDGVIPILEELCAGPIIVQPVGCEDHRFTVRLLTAEGQDIAAVVIEELNLNIGYDGGAPDEGFSELREEEE